LDELEKKPLTRWRKWEKRNPDKVRVYRDRENERARAKRAAERAANPPKPKRTPEEIKERDRLYSIQWRAKNKERIHEYAAEYYATKQKPRIRNLSPEAREKQREIWRECRRKQRERERPEREARMAARQAEWAAKREARRIEAEQKAKERAERKAAKEAERAKAREAAAARRKEILALGTIAAAEKRKQRAEQIAAAKAEAAKLKQAKQREEHRRKLGLDREQKTYTAPKEKPFVLKRPKMGRLQALSRWSGW
jgi:colicin import membrane protein